MEYLRGFRAMRQDPAWMSKVGVASLILFSGAFVPLLGGLVLRGWLAQMTRESATHEQPASGEMPRLDFDFGWLGKLLQIGFKPFIVGFLWQLPVGILTGLSVVCGYFGFVFSVLASSRHHSGPPVAAFAVLGLAFLVIVPLSIALGLPAAVATLRAEITDDIKAGLDFGAVLRMTRLVMPELLIGVLVLGLVGTGLGMLGLVCCYIGVFPAAVVMQILTAHFHAQLYELYLSRGGEPLPVGHPQLTSAPAVATPPAAPPTFG